MDIYHEICDAEGRMPRKAGRDSRVRLATRFLDLVRKLEGRPMTNPTFDFPHSFDAKEFLSGRLLLQADSARWQGLLFEIVGSATAAGL